ncbi:MAG: substrate-binding domain-containing protein [Paramuribaculum sp.]|nr:substrate-binding domain-containing protein [Paramuribaculum sp.]
MNEELIREIVLHPEATIEIRSANDDNEKQAEDIRYFLNNNFDIILVAPNEADAITPVVEEVYNSGVPVVIFDRNINGESYTAMQGVDDEGIGRSAAHYAATHYGDNITVIELQGLPGSTPAIARNAGFQQEARKHNFNTVATAYGNWNYEDAADVVDSLLEENPDVDLIFAHNDRMAIAASEIARKRGLSTKVIGIDAVPEVGVKAVADSVIDATFIYPSAGDKLINTALAILKGEPYQRKNILPPSSPVDASNVDLIIFQNQSIDENAEKIKILKGDLDNYWEKHSSQTYLFNIVIVLVIILCVFVFLLLRAFWQRKKYHDEILRQNKLLEEQRDTEKELNRQLHEVTQSKLMFFTNVSHDLRTPLTLIAEPVSQLADAENLDPTQKKLIGIAKRNVIILNRLINQILDFRKYEHGKLALHVSEANLLPLISDWTESFIELAKRHNMRLTAEIDIPDGFSMAIDVEKIERVFFNLMSNAFKYTPEHGNITLSCYIKDNELFLSVKDNGQGISAMDIDNIFDRFYQADKVHPKGSGIGLSLAKAFVEMHGGTISVESELGEGTEFIVRIPVTHTEGIPSSSFERSVTTEDVEAELGEKQETTLSNSDNKPLLLVIDDNLDIRQLIGELMSDEYSIIFASNGKEGVRMATKYIPDLIICDVMMPEMDGLDCSNFIKGEVSTSHIPILMLTACALDEQRISGYEHGADGYISKPFSSKLLKIRCKNLMDNRRRIYDYLSGEGCPPSAKRKEKPTEGITDMENEFYSRFISRVKEKMSDPDLNVDALASDMGLGRSQLYRKIKALTNCSPVEIIRDLRLKKARELLTATDMTISEIAYQVGFSTPAYFTRCYREVYNETPTDLRDKIISKKTI